MKKIKRNIKNSDHGVVGIIVTLMIIGLFVSALAMVQTVFVPKWMEQKEAEHMDEVANQFTQLKFAIDTLSLVGEENIPVSTPVTLGSEEMPFLTTMRSYGDLSILPNNCKIIITYKTQSDPPNEVSDPFIIGTIMYSSSNAYYMDQTYVYENGALILKQQSSDVMSIQPSLSVLLKKDLSLTVFKISEIGDKTSAGGYGTYPVQTRFIDSTVYNYYDVKSIEIETTYHNAWLSFLEDILISNDPDFDFEANVDINPEQDGVIVDFIDDSDNDIFLPNLDLKVIDIGAQISPGWVE
jgi:hypothetical protein